MKFLKSQVGQLTKQKHGMFLGLDLGIIYAIQ